MAKKRVLVSVPNINKWIHKETLLFLFDLFKDERYDLTLTLPTHRPLSNNQHHIVNEFVSGNFDYWFSLDNDIVPLKNPLDLVELDKDIIGLAVPMWRFRKDLKHYKDKRIPSYWGFYTYDEDEGAYAIQLPQGKELQQVDAISGGCFIIARRVFDNKLLRTRGWWRRLKEDGTVLMGNDLSFCWKAKKEGFEVWAHFGYAAKHFKNIDLNTVLEVYER